MAHEHRRIINQTGYTLPEADRVFAEGLRRLLLKVVAMIEDRYGLRPINADRHQTSTLR